MRRRSRTSTSPAARLAALACGVALAAVAAPAYAAEGDAAADGAAADAERSVQVVMVNFQDSTLTGTTKLKSQLESTYYGRSASLTSYYNEITRGKTTFGPRDAAQKVVGPFTLPMSAAGCDTSKMAAETYKALAAEGIAEDSFDHVSIVFPNAKADCGFAGLGSVGGPKTWMPAEHFSIDALIHEFGHNLGYHHHMRLRCPEGDLGAGCKEDAKDSTSHKSVMGGGGSAAGLTAPELIHNKWLTGGELAQVGRSGTYTLRPLAGTGPGVRALSIPLGADRLVVEFRARSGALDADVHGVYAYKVTSDDYAKSAFIDPTPGTGEAADADALKTGAELKDTARKVSVKVVSTGTGSAKVAVSLNGVPAPAGGTDAAPQTGGTPQAAEATEGTGASADTRPDSAGQGGPGPADEGADQAGPADARPADSATGSAQPSGEHLATTGSDSSTLPLTVGGAAFLALGALALIKLRRRRS